MSDNERLVDWQLLEPTLSARRRMDVRVAEWLEASDASLMDEWLSLFRIAPMRTAGLLTASAVGMVVASPLLWILRALL